MKRNLSLAIAATLILGACSAPHGASTALPGAKTTAQKHVRHLKSAGRAPLNVLGGAPPRLFDVVLDIFDAPLIGATAANSQFNAGILGVDAIDANGDSWQLIANDKAQVVNLLALQTSSMNLGKGTLPEGSYPAIQLLLDPSVTSVTYNGQTYPAQFVDPNHPWWDPTQAIEAVTIPLDVTGSDGQTIGASLDFNVFQSANLANGVVLLTPTVTAGLGSPSITGTVANAAGAPVANAMIVATDAGGNVTNTSVSGADGTFHIHGIKAGGYTITVANTYTTNAGMTVTAADADPGASPSTYVIVGPNSQINLGTLND
ncbi:MAG TPA: carboxypeptidase regulatory-like domain-containing protein [Candidatus Elarobacter sp.]|jgi:hypothetical protein|nr:carboxypeptidase regulatory-like domain-containing protein [Candidatus Elarobacter sp.]